MTSCGVFIRPCGDAESLAIKRNIWARSLSYEAVCFDILDTSPYRNAAVAGNDVHLISVIFNFVTTTNTQFNSGRKTIYSGKYCRQNRLRENTDYIL